MTAASAECLLDANISLSFSACRLSSVGVGAVEKSLWRMIEVTIKETRQKEGLTQVEVKTIVGIPISTLQDWESGRHAPPAWLERLVCDALVNRVRIYRYTIWGQFPPGVWMPIFSVYERDADKATMKAFEIIKAHYKTNLDGDADIETFETTQTATVTTKYDGDVWRFNIKAERAE